MKLSIIVPVYNVEKFLSKCLKSLQNQDLPKNQYEIIVINDGSTDSSYIIAQEEASFTNNIVLLSQENKGLSATRNRGVQEAKGKYIYFVDSDDFIAPNVLKTLLETLEDNDLEVLAFNLTKVDIYYKIDNHLLNNTKHELSSIVDGATFLTERGFAAGSYWFMIRKDFLLRIGLKYVEGRMLEDIIFNAKLFPQINRIAFLPIDVYYYVIHQESIMRNTNTDHYLRLIDDYEFALVELNSIISNLIDKIPQKAIYSMRSFQSNFLSFLFVRIMRSTMKTKAIHNVIARLKEEEMYPIQTYGGNFKDMFMRFVINHKVFYFPAVYLYRLFF